MEELWASYSKKPVNFSRGDKVSGEVVTITDSEVIVDFGGKSEGLLNKKDLTTAGIDLPNIGDQISAYVVSGEGEGQIVLSLQPPAAIKPGSKNRYDFRRFEKFIQAMNKKTQLQGKIVELNKGGFVVEVDGVRGFLPISQLALGNVLHSIKSAGLEELIGEVLTISVIEVDPGSNKLIFSTRGTVSAQEKEHLKKFTVGQEVEGKVAVVAPFGIVVKIEDDPQSLEGVIFSQEVSWEGEADLGSNFQVGQQITAQVVGIDENLGRVNLSLKRMVEDPFEKMSQDFVVDDVVKGTVTEVSGNGVMVKLREGVEGFIPNSKIEQGTGYSIGQEVSVLVDSIDKIKRRINLAPFLTSTKGLFYK